VVTTLLSGFVTLPELVHMRSGAEIPFLPGFEEL
jgi:hypothetical protein